MLIYLDGKLVKKEDAKISVFDHGFLYGDGVFEGIRAYHGKIFRLAQHLDRLYEAAHVIMLKIPIMKEEMEKAVIETLKANNMSDSYIRIVVSRGPGDLGLDPAKCPGPTLIIITDKLSLYPKDFYKNGLEIVSVSVRRNISAAINPRIKSLNYLNNILAKIEAKQSGALEAIMLNSDGYVAECTGDNIFIFKDGILKTPPTYVGALKGITRDAVIECAKKLKIEVREDIFTQYEVYTASECFLTGTGAEIVPVVAVDRRIIGDGKPGQVTMSLLKAFKELTQNEGVGIN